MLKNKVVRGTVVGAAAFLLATLFQATGLLRPLEWKSWDLRMRAFADPGRASKNIALVLVDQYSLDYYREQGISWPWPRQMYGALLDYLVRGGARACFFDIEMSEPSVYGVDDDRLLAESAARAGNVVLPVALSIDKKKNAADAEALLRRFSISPPAGLASDGFLSATMPLPELLRAARGVGNITVPPDADGIYRRIRVVSRFGDLGLPSVPAAISALADGPAPDSIPLDPGRNMIIRYLGPTGTYRSIPAATLINSWAMIGEGAAPQIPPADFAGKIVLVGLSAVGLHDLKSSPLSAITPGVEIQAAALDTILSRSFFRSVSPIAAAVFALVVAVLASIAVSSLRKIRWIAGAYAASIVVPAAASAAAFSASRWLEFVYPLSGVLFSLFGAAILNYGIEGRERRFLKRVFRHYLSPHVIDGILENPDKLVLGGEEREITSFFSDIAGFTTISEPLAPSDLVALLNAYLTEMTDLILDAGGTLDKYEGDAIIAFWNAPLDDPAHAVNACRTALACERRLLELESGFRQRFGHALRNRIGLNTGPAVVGNMGSHRRFDYTAMGDTVNLASRLESAGKIYGVPILIGEATAARVRDTILVREIDRVRVVGRSTPVRIYEPLAEWASLPPAVGRAAEAHERALTEFRSRSWAKAEEMFRARDDDPVARIYLDRCREYIRVPPPEDWDAVIDLKSK
jgi:adenylate cyclase